MADQDARITELRERITRLRAEQRGDGMSSEAGELADYDQHQADAATTTYDREDREGIIANLEERLRRLEQGLDEEPEAFVAPTDPDDVSTPLDEPAPREQLNYIPMAESRADVEADPQEDDDRPYLAMPGEIYSSEQGPAHLGRPEGDDERLEREYRPN